MLAQRMNNQVLDPISLIKPKEAAPVPSYSFAGHSPELVESSPDIKGGGELRFNTPRTPETMLSTDEKLERVRRIIKSAKTNINPSDILKELFGNISGTETPLDPASKN